MNYYLFALSIPKRSLPRTFRHYRLRFLRREYTMEFGHMPMWVFGATFVFCAVFTYFACLFATLIIRG